MKSRVLNAWSSKGRHPEGAEVSVVSFESTAVPSSIVVQGPFPAPGGDHLARVVLAGVGLTMAEDEILVADGFVRKFSVRKFGGEDSVSADILSEYPTTVVTSVTPGMPSRIDVTLSRKPLLDLMLGRRIAVDPGHGGKDHGIKGPVNLLEKDCALAVAKELETILQSAGAVPLLTRNDDSYLAPGFRLAEVSALSPEFAVEIHTSGETEPLSRAYHARAKEGCGRSAALARSVSDALNERMGTVFDDTEDMAGAGEWGFPIVRIEPVCLTHFADEANFRAPLYRKRIAQGIFNGLARYLRSSSKERGGASA